jgi:hypothetical protein
MRIVLSKSQNESCGISCGRFVRNYFDKFVPQFAYAPSPCDCRCFVASIAEESVLFPNRNSNIFVDAKS